MNAHYRTAAAGLAATAFPAALAAVLAAAVTGCTGASGVAPTPAPRIAARQASADANTARLLFARFDSLRIAHHIPGLAVVLLRDTTIIRASGFGVADIERAIAVTPETPFDIASVAKPISAVVALRLAQDGLLDLDRPMRRYRDFIEFCNAARGDGGIFFSDYACTDDRLTMRHVLSMTANGAPGTRFWYNPPSYSWASRPMAEVSGHAFSELVDSLVIRPAAMQQSARRHRRLPLPPNIAASMALPYHVDSAGQLRKSDPPAAAGRWSSGWRDRQRTGSRPL